MILVPETKKYLYERNYSQQITIFLRKNTWNKKYMYFLSKHFLKRKSKSQVWVIIFRIRKTHSAHHWNGQGATVAYECVCFQGFTGQNCDQSVDTCLQLAPCRNGAVCTVCSIQSNFTRLLLPVHPFPNAL